MACTLGGVWYIHGHTTGLRKTPTYRVWASMMQRCTNPKNQSYADYGGRGIRICFRWLTFANFLADMGERPPGLTLERIDNAGNYEPGNCRWATYSAQNLNRRRPAYYDRPPRVNECGHPELPHLARGMCGTCYRRSRRATGLS